MYRKLEDEEQVEAIRDCISSTKLPSFYCPIDYSTENADNYGEYCSPLRKYDCLYNERVIAAAYLDHDYEKIEEYRDQLDYVCEKMNQKKEHQYFYESEYNYGVKKLMKMRKNIKC